MSVGGGGGVSVGGSGVSVGGGVFVGGSGVSVGRGGVFVGGDGVSVGGSWVGVGISVGVGGTGVTVGVRVGTGVDVGVGVLVGVRVGVVLGVLVEVSAAVAVGVWVGLAVGVLAGVSVAVLVGVAVAVWAGVTVSTSVGSTVGTRVAVSSPDTSVGIAGDIVNSAPCEAGVPVALSPPLPPPPRAYIPNATMNTIPATATAKGRAENFHRLAGVGGVTALALMVGGSASLFGKGAMTLVLDAAAALCKAATNSPALRYLSLGLFAKARKSTPCTSSGILRLRARGGGGGS